MWMWKCFTVVAESGPVFTTVRKPDSRTPLISATFGTTDIMWPKTSSGTPSHMSS